MTVIYVCLFVIGVLFLACFRMKVSFSNSLSFMPIWILVSIWAMILENKFPVWLNIFYIIICGVVAVTYWRESVQLWRERVQLAGGKKGKPEANDDSMYGEKDETEE